MALLNHGSVLNSSPTSFFTRPASNVALPLSFFAGVPLRHFCMSRMRDEEGRSHESLEGSSASERGRAGAQQDVSSLGLTLTYAAAQIDRRRLRPEPLFSIAQSNPIPSRWPTAAADYSCHLACHLILAHPAVRHPPHSLPLFPPFTCGAALGSIGTAASTH